MSAAKSLANSLDQDQAGQMVWHDLDPIQTTCILYFDSISESIVFFVCVFFFLFFFFILFLFFFLFFFLSIKFENNADGKKKKHATLPSMQRVRPPPSASLLLQKHTHAKLSRFFLPLLKSKFFFY